MTIEIVRPVPADNVVSPRRVVLAPRTAGGHGPRTLGLVSNGKLKAGEILVAIGDVLVARGVVDEYLLHTKPTASNPMDEQERGRMLARSHVIVTGVGD